MQKLSMSVVLLSVMLLASCVSLHASEPAFDRVNYSKPSDYLVVNSSLGNVEEIARVASKLKGRDDTTTIRKVLDWMHANLEYDPDAAYEWRNFDDAVQDRCYGGCADQGIVCGVLLKAAGIPTVWVKTMDVEWIWDFKKQRPFDAWSGHVFLEVYVDEKWILLDPGAKLVYPDYSTASRILPGNRFAYDKGNQPKQMIMSLQWEQWKEQTRRYFEQLAPSLLPVDAKGAVSVVPQVYIIGNDPYYKVLADMAHRKGWSVRNSFNSEYERCLPAAKGHVLLIETHRGTPIVPADVLHKVFPEACRGLKASDGVIEVEGTQIMFVDLAKMLEGIGEE